MKNRNSFKVWIQQQMRAVCIPVSAGLIGAGLLVVPASSGMAQEAAAQQKEKEEKTEFVEKSPRTGTEQVQKQSEKKEEKPGQQATGKQAEQKSEEQKPAEKKQAEQKSAEQREAQQEKQSDRQQAGRDQQQGQRARILSGEIVESGEEEIKVRLSSGETRTFKISEQTNIWLDDEQAEIGQLERGTRVRIHPQRGDDDRIVSIDASRRSSQDRRSASGDREQPWRDSRNILMPDRQQDDRSAQRDREDFAQDRRGFQYRYGTTAGRDRDDRYGSQQDQRWQDDRSRDQRFQAQQDQRYGFQQDQRFQAQQDPRYGLPRDQRYSQQDQRYGYQQDRRFGEQQDDRYRDPRLQEQQAFRRDERRAGLGVTLNPRDDGREGVQVTRVHPGSPADRAGLRPGDRILAVDGRQVTDPDTLGGVIGQKNPGDEIELRLRRDDQSWTYGVMLADRDQALPRDDDRQTYGQQDQRFQDQRFQNQEYQRGFGQYGSDRSQYGQFDDRRDSGRFDDRGTYDRAYQDRDSRRDQFDDQYQNRSGSFYRAPDGSDNRNQNQSSRFENDRFERFQGFDQ